MRLILFDRLPVSNKISSCVSRIQIHLPPISRASFVLCFCLGLVDPAFISLCRGTYSGMDLLDKMDKYVRYRGASASPDDELLLPLADQYTRSQSISFERSAPSSVNDATGFNTSTLLLSQVDKDKSRIKICHVKLINIAEIVRHHFFGDNSDAMDLFLNEEAANLVIFRKYFCTLFKENEIVDEVGHFQLYFTAFIDRLIKQLGDGNFVKSMNSELKETKLYLKASQRLQRPSTKVLKMKSGKQRQNCMRESKQVSSKLARVSGATNLFVSVMCSAVPVQSSAGAPALAASLGS